MEENSIFIDLLIEYTKAQMKMIEDNPSMTAGVIHYKLQKTIEYMEGKKSKEHYLVKGER